MPVCQQSMETYPLTRVFPGFRAGAWVQEAQGGGLGASRELSHKEGLLVCRVNYGRLGRTASQKGPCPSLFCYIHLSGSVETAEKKHTATLEACLGEEAGPEEGEMALPSEIPVAAHLLIKHQKEHACFFPSAATAISSTSVGGWVAFKLNIFIQDQMKSCLFALGSVSSVRAEL